MVKYPSIRQELFEFVSGLADIDYQRQAWVNKIFPPGIEYDSFDEAVHFFYDDTRRAKDPEREIGIVLENGAEAVAIHALIDRLNVVLAKVGKNAKDEEYLASPGWAEVVSAAQTVLGVLRSST